MTTQPEPLELSDTLRQYLVGSTRSPCRLGAYVNAPILVKEPSHRPKSFGR